MNLRTLIESILLESEIDNIIKNKKEKLSKGKMGSNPEFSKEFDYYAKEFIKNVPTPKKYISKFFDLIESLFNENVYGHTYKENFETIYYYFNKWMLYKSKNLINKDILAQTHESLIDIVEEVEESQKIRESERKIDKVFDNDRWLVIKVNTMEASCKYGANTQWCISATKGTNRFTGYGYSENNYIYFVIDKKEKLSPEDSLYKMAILVNKKTSKIEVWDAEDKQLSTSQVTILNRFIPEVFDAIFKNVLLSQIELDEKFIIESLRSYTINVIKNYPRTFLKYNTDYSKIWLKYQLPNTHHWIEVDIDTNENNISSTFYHNKLINNEETGERYYGSSEISIISKVEHVKINKENFIPLIKKSVIDVLNSPEVKKFFIDYPEEYFSGINLYQDIENLRGRKVPQKAFITAIKLLKEKGEQNITTIRRIVDQNLAASHNVKPLLTALHSFGLIKLEKRGNSVMVIPTNKLIKTPLNKLI